MNIELLQIFAGSQLSFLDTLWTLLVVGLLPASIIIAVSAVVLKRTKLIRLAGGLFIVWLLVFFFL